MNVKLYDTKNINNLLYLPVVDGMWKQHELWDGTYTFDDWLDIVEIISVRKANEDIIQGAIDDMRNS